MKITKTKIRSLIKEVLTEMDRRERNFRAAQYRYDNMLPPDYDGGRPSESVVGDEIFEYAFEELIDFLVEDAIDEGILVYDEANDILKDVNGTVVASYDEVGNLSYPDEKVMVDILKSNFREDMYADQYDEYMIDQEENERAQARDDYYNDY